MMQAMGSPLVVNMSAPRHSLPKSLAAASFSSRWKSFLRMSSAKGVKVVGGQLQDTDIRG